MLRNDISGFIMTCGRMTVAYCLQNMLFGGRAGTYPVCHRIQVGDRGFLINTSSDEIHGIFEAISLASPPANPWVPTAWGGRGATEFPVQIRVRQIEVLPPIPHQSRIWGEMGIITYMMGLTAIPRYSILTPDVVERLIRDYFHRQGGVPVSIPDVNPHPAPTSEVPSPESKIQSTFADLRALKQKEEEVFYLYDYHKVWIDKATGIRNPSFDVISADLLRVKRNEADQVARFTAELQNLIKRDATVVICVMPSHRQGLQPSGIRTIATGICGGDRIDGTNCLIRTHDTPPNHMGGARRTYEEELASLALQDKQLIQGRPVVLLDDVTTTGTSLKAGKEVLKQAGAAAVICLALGMTVSE